MSPSKPTFALVLPLLLGARLALADVPDEAPPQLPQESLGDSEPSPAPAEESAPAPAAPAAPLPEPVPAPEPTPVPPAATEPAPAPAPNWLASVGVRVTYVGSKGFDAFAENDALAQATLNFAGTVYRRDRVSIAVMGSFDVGGREATARGEKASLTAMSFALGPEARWHFGEWARVHARPSLSLTRTHASLDETSSNAALHARSWLSGFDVMAGGAISLGRLARERNERAWLLAEGGYVWSTEATLAFRPDDDDTDAPLRAAPLDLGKLSLRGPAFRIAAALTF